MIYLQKLISRVRIPNKLVAVKVIAMMIRATTTMMMMMMMMMMTTMLIIMRTYLMFTESYLIMQIIYPVLVLGVPL